MSQELLSRCILVVIAAVCLIVAAYNDYKRDRSSKEPKDAERESERHNRMTKEK